MERGPQVTMTMTLIVASVCSPAPIDRCRHAGNDCDMNVSAMPLADDASALLAAAMRLEDDANEPGSVALVASALGDVEQALRALGCATQHAADALIPPGAPHEGPSRRYARAAATWQRLGGGPPPTHERQAQILTALHDAAATLRAGAECCRRARDILDTAA
jgi:hypothetical protein